VPTGRAAIALDSAPPNAAIANAADPDEVPTVSLREARRRLKLEVCRAQILDVAEAAFGEFGYHDASLRMVAERCELAVGTLYNFFADKEDLFSAVLDRGGHELAGLMRAAANAGRPAGERLLDLAELEVRFFIEHPGWARITTGFISPGSRASLPGGNVAQNYEAGYRAAMDLQAEVIADGQQQATIRAGDPQVLARMFSAMVSMYHVIDDEAEDRAISFSVEDFLGLIRTTFIIAEPSTVSKPSRTRT